MAAIEVQFRLSLNSHFLKSTLSPSPTKEINSFTVLCVKTRNPSVQDWWWTLDHLCDMSSCSLEWRTDCFILHPDNFRIEFCVWEKKIMMEKKHVLYSTQLYKFWNTTQKRVYIFKRRQREAELRNSENDCVEWGVDRSSLRVGFHSCVSSHSSVKWNGVHIPTSIVFKKKRSGLLAVGCGKEPASSSVGGF